MNQIVSTLLIHNLQIVTLFRVAILVNHLILTSSMPFVNLCQIDIKPIIQEKLCQFFVT